MVGVGTVYIDDCGDTTEIVAVTKERVTLKAIALAPGNEPRRAQVGETWDVPADRLATLRRLLSIGAFTEVRK